MLLTLSTYFIILFILVLINSIPVFGSPRTRRFGQVPSLFFILLITAFAVVRLIGFLTPDMSSTQLKQNDLSYDINFKKGRIYTKPEDVKKEKAQFISKNAIDSEQKKYYDASKYIIKFAYMQALFVVLLSYWGMKKFEHRSPYYIPKIRNHSIFFVLCVLLDLFVV